MHCAPPKPAEIIVGLLIPPACREEVLGDLHERCTSRRQYISDALGTVPLVIMSRIRRTADPAVLLMEAFVLYLSFIGAAWYQDRAFLYEQRGFLRLAIPAAVALLALILEDAYARPGKRSPLKPIRGPLLGLGAAFLSQAVLSTGNRPLAVPAWIVLYGGAMGLLLASAIRILFPPVAERPLGAGGPAFWLKQAAEPARIPPAVLGMFKGRGAIMAVALLMAWLGGTILVKPLIVAAALLLVVYELSKRG
jgi:hypothetical protein